MAMKPKDSPTFSYTGNASTKIFAVPFAFLESNDLVVTVAGTAKTLGTDYTVSGGNGAQGSITFGTAPANSAAIVISTIYPGDTSSPIARRWNDLGNPIDGPLNREPNYATSANQVNQKRTVNERTEAQIGVAQSVYPIA